MEGIIKPGNAGLVTTTGGGVADLCHTLSLTRSLIITKIMAYNATGANVTLQFGTLNRATPAVFVPGGLLPIFVAINGLDNEWLEEEIPAVEFMSWPQATAAGRTGDVYVVGGAAGVVVQIEVKEFA